jgi:hypothetical protein
VENVGVEAEGIQHGSVHEPIVPAAGPGDHAEGMPGPGG